MMVLGGQAFGRCLGHESGALRNGMSAPYLESPWKSFTPSTMWDYSEKTDVSEEVGSHQTPSLLALWS